MTWVNLLKVSSNKGRFKEQYIKILDDLTNLLINLAVKLRAKEAWHTK